MVQLIDDSFFNQNDYSVFTRMIEVSVEFARELHTNIGCGGFCLESIGDFEKRVYRAVAVLENRGAAIDTDVLQRSCLRARYLLETHAMPRQAAIAAAPPQPCCLVPPCPWASCLFASSSPQA